MNGWSASAAAWIADMGEDGDKGRRYILDPVMVERVGRRPFRRMLDVGCGEGRFCRKLAAIGVATTGLDPTPELLARARELDPDGDYIEASAGCMPFADASFDLVVSYLSLIDIPDFQLAIAEMARVLAPGGMLLVANLTALNTAGEGLRWQRDASGALSHYGIDHYMTERSSWEEWRGIRIQNWHRPLSAYMKAFLGEGLELTFFDEPTPVGGDPDFAAKVRRAPWYLVMEWAKPA